MIELEKRMKSLEERLNSMVQVGTVTEVIGGAVRVELNGHASHELPVLFPKTQTDKFYAMPDVGEQVVCIFLPIGLEQGFVLGAIYSDEDEPPADGSHLTHITFGDGTVMAYDRKAHNLDITVNGGEVTVKADKVTLDCGGEMGGVITDKSICKFDGKPHVDASKTVIASK
ncbi:hypothetical protein DSLASN_05200 [Desulfoluna limicola]|uniref:Phage baseplate assembly protein V n=1 Tax=Desulfoluna limicola TaxID=2810562 RepID=A0ABM7PCF7_9BACT|nr:phage baseplate assembly protein V [Desulfoluna limicola]BCS94888.1 hypothetical protein DSLASN_05200 [Desulfoluna limicola]